MVWTAQLASIIRRWFHRRQVEEDLDSEVEAHFDLLAERYVKEGMSPEAARRAARVKFGGPEEVKQNVREGRIGAALETTVQDIRYGMRSLLKSPFITAVAVLSLALGIGANTAIFSVINAVMLRSLPVHDADRLILMYTLGRTDADDINFLSLAMFDELSKEQRVLSDIFSWQGGQMSSFEAEGQYFAGMLTSVSGSYFSTLGVTPLMGRLIQPADVSLYSATSAQVAVLSYRCWQNRFQGDPAAIGKTIRVNGHPLTVIGVTPAYFSGLVIDLGEDVTIPLGAQGDTEFRDRKHLALGLYARLKPGVSIGQARTQIESIWPSILRAAEPEGYTGPRRDRYYAWKIQIESVATGHSNMRKRLSKPLTVLMALVGIVLLTGCVNLANLMLARAAGRRHELAVRTTLGASDWRLARQLLTESVMLSLTGAALGFVVAIWTSRILLTTMWTAPVPLALDAAPDLRVLAFTAAISVITAVLFGLMPVWRALHTDPADALRQNTRQVRGAGRIGRVLVSGQVALSMVIVLVGGLFIHSLRNMQSANPGFKRQGVLVMQLMAQPGRQLLSNREAYYREIVDQVSRLPGVVAASFSVLGPVNRAESRDYVAADRADETAQQVTAERAAGDVVGPGFFQLIGMRVLAGREFTWSDDEKAPAVTVISQSLAARLFPGRDAVGRYVDLNPGVNQKRMRVVGVVNSASLWRIQSHEPPAIYQPLLQVSPTGSYLDIRSAGDPATISRAASKVVEDMGHEYPLFIQTLDQRVDRMTVDERMIAWLSAFFGVLALLLGSIGLYGLMADAVMQRTPEIGIRMALGAERGSVVWLVLRDVLLLVGAGILVGVPAALAASKYIAGMLFGLSVTDPETLSAAIVALLTVGMFAGYLPARHASRIDPMTALRTD